MQRVFNWFGREFSKVRENLLLLIVCLQLLIIGMIASEQWEATDVYATNVDGFATGYDVESASNAILDEIKYSCRRY